ncbi:MAG: protoporphyrinogen oxidase [Magnetococcales bacterium]|nr:protoporphyrinogen oxidase [Magnetococcales bacterium]
MNDTPKKVIIIGGGISGLSTAWFLHRAGIPVCLFERETEAGGSIRTRERNGYRVEEGPNSTLQKPKRPEDALGRLLAGLGVEDRLQEAATAGAIRYVVRDGRLQPLPASPPAFLTTSLFSWRAKLRLLAEPFIGRAADEESIASFVRRRLGQEFLDYAIEPFISGVYAGDPRQLSVRAAVPRIHALEAEYGSLLKGALALGQVNKGAGMPKGRLVSFDGGMQFLSRAISRALPPGSVRTGLRITRLSRHERGEPWRCYWEGRVERGIERGDQLVLSVPAREAAFLLRELAPQAAAVLEGIPYAPIASVALGYARAQVAHSLNGFGFLIPRKEGVRSLGGLFSSSLFPGRAPEGHCLLTAFIGGAMDTAFPTETTPDLAARVVDDMAHLLGIQGAPHLLAPTRYERAIPQYTLGHLQRIAAIDRHLEALPGLWTRANWRDGIAVAECVRQAELTAERIVARWTSD